VSASALRPRTVTELVDAAFQLLRRHYLQFVSISAVFLIPVVVIQTLFIRTPVPGQLPNPAVALVFLPALLLSLLGTSAVVVGVSDSYVRDRVDVGHAVQRVLSRFFPILGGALSQLLVIFFGMLGLMIGGGIVVALVSIAIPVGSARVLMTVLVFPAFVLAGLTIFARIFAVPLVIVLEGASVGQAFRRSTELTRGSVWRVIGVFTLTFIVLMALFGSMLVVIALLSSQAPRASAIYSVIGGTVNILAYPIFTVFITLLYYDLRIRRDGFDLEMMTKELAGVGQS
jgi:hypothetical protein